MASYARGLSLALLLPLCSIGGPLQLDGQVVASERYVLISPFDGRIVHIAETGSVQRPLPPLKYQDFLDYLGGNSLNVDPGVARVEYSADVYAALREHWRKAEGLRSVLISNRLRSPDLKASPDQSESEGVEYASTMEFMRAQTHGAETQRALSEVRRLKTRLTGSDRTSVISEWRQRLRKDRAQLTDDALEALLQRVVNGLLREYLKLDSKHFQITTGNQRLPEDRPNSLDAIGASGEVVFFLQAAQDSNQAGERSIRRFREYWAAVYADDCYSEEDKGFLARLFPALAVQSATLALLKQVDAALTNIDRVRTAERVLFEAFAGLPLNFDRNTADAAVSTAIASLKSSPDGALLATLKPAATTALDLGKAAPGSGVLTSDTRSIAWLASELVMGYASGTVTVPAFPKLLASQPNIVVVADPRLVLVTSKNAKAKYVPLFRFSGEWLSGRVGSATPEDALSSLFAQYEATLHPTARSMSLRADTMTADALYSFAMVVQALESEYRRAVDSLAQDVRTSLIEHRNRAFRGFRALRYGAFTVPEDAVVEHVSAVVGNRVLAGSPIAHLRPLKRYAFEARTDFKGSNFFVPGTKWDLALNCETLSEGGETPNRRSYRAQGEVDSNVRAETSGAYWLRIAVTSPADTEAPSVPSIGDQCTVTLTAPSRS